jgi:hypothetical protein
MITVKATREGLLGAKTASNWVISPWVPAVALPSIAALHLWLVITNPLTGKALRAVVLDVGPWNEDDDAYVFGGARPQAECGVDKRGRPTNGAGIDLTEAVWKALGYTDNGECSWSFV